MSNLLINLKPAEGYNNVFELGEYNMQLTRFGILQLAAGNAYSGNTGEFEVALVLLGGKCKVAGDDFEFAEEDRLRKGCRGHCFCCQHRRYVTG